jgi:hypothetical protein
MWTGANGDNARGRLARTRQRSRKILSGRMMAVQQAANRLTTIPSSADELLYQLPL